MRFFPCLALLFVCHALSACELVADFDRGKLDAGKPVDSGVAPIFPEAGDDDAMDAGDADAGH